MRRVRLYQVDALVLRRSDFGEADRLLTLLTPQAGKVRAIAKGARRPTSRHSGNLELFSHARLLLARGRELEIVSQSHLLQPFRRVREHLETASHAYYLTEVTDAFLEPSDDATAVFTLLLGALTAMEEGTAEPSLLAAHYLLLLLDALGFRPELFVCLGCRSELRPVRNFLSIPQGGVFCPACGSRQPGARLIEPDVLKVLRNLLRVRAPGGLVVSVPPPVLGEVERVVRLLVEHHLDRRLRSPEFIGRLRELEPAIGPNAGVEARSSGSV